ncbi:TIGR00341 family protein [Lujinxingia vulgaris]|uniref:TIGR00341 family protein n=1 Tax=Lujinxingia vulgaris TaxID=2600176 RepID=A0A5C6XDC9_9DELT|nr:TIGR00341 family protein [Lujinxingia vulgaris]TXD40847.1 TIGR00341 family protein [Lujinxingia vulgaris]
MALRQVDIYLPPEHEPLGDLEDAPSALSRHDLTLDDDATLTSIILETGDSDALLEWLHNKVGDIEGHRIVVLEVLATLPRQGEDEGETSVEELGALQNGNDNNEEEEEGNGAAARISREEVYQDVTDSIAVTNVHYALVALSTIVAAGGMLRDSTAVVIGAMVIAPLIGPNIALALGATLADWKLIRRSALVNFLGLLLGLVLAVIGGFFLPVDITVGEIASRTRAGLADVVLALAAGAAGVLSVTRGVSTALIGVMVAVALLPPLVATGLLLGTANWAGAYGAGMLTLINLVAINLAGIITFQIQGIRPMTWYDEEKARRPRIYAIILWVVLLLALAAGIVFAPPETITGEESPSSPELEIDTPLEDDPDLPLID